MALALLAAACSSAGEPELSEPVPVEADYAPPTALPFSDVEAGPDTLRLAMPKPLTIDPAKVSLVDQSAVIVSDLIYDGLVEATQGRLEPGLALSWEHGGNFSTWSFTVNTRRITPEQVKASFERLVATSPSSASVALLSNVFGVAEVRDGDNTRISGITVVNATTLEIRLIRPDAGFPWLLSGVKYSIVGPDAAPTGRYVVATDDGSNLVLTSDSGVDVAINWTADGDAAQALLDDGVADAALVEFAPENGPRSIVKFFALNTLAPDLVGVETRQAILAAVDMENLAIETGSDLIPVDGAAASVLAGWQADACLTVCDLNPELSQVSIASLGAAPFLTIAYVGGTDALIAHEISDDLANAGYGTEVVQFEADDMAEAIANGEAEIFAFGWATPGHSVDSVISALFSSRSELNVARLASSNVDELLAAASGLGDDTLRWALLQQAHSEALGQAVLMPVGAARNHLLVAESAPPLAVRADGSIDLSVGN